MTKAEVATFFDTLAQHIKPESEIDWDSPLDLLIAVVLSAQTTDKAVNKATPWFRQHCRTPQDYLDVGQNAIEERIRSIGLAKNKAKSIIGICRMLRDDFNGEIPDTREGLQQLPGVGRKTANVILNVLFRQPTLAVDTHIFRVANRVGLVNEDTPEKTERALVKRIPKQHLLDAHHYLILHGRYSCVARKPKCSDCVVRDVCKYELKSG